MASPRNTLKPPKKYETQRAVTTALSYFLKSILNQAIKFILANIVYNLGSVKDSSYTSLVEASVFIGLK
jgi:hypothetical protein